MLNKHNPTRGMSHKERRDYYVTLAIEKFGNKFDYSLIKELPLKKSPVVIKCLIHGKLKISFYNHLACETGCHQCGQDKARKNKKYTHNKFIEIINKKYPDRKWKIISKYNHNKIPIYVQDKYGICLIQPNSMLTRSTPNIKTAIDKNEYIKNKFIEVHKNYYDYSEFIYLGVKIPSTIICKKHGEFQQHANLHLSGRGCMKCGKDRTKDALKSTTYEFINKAQKVHENTYDYSDSEYINARTHLKIKCSIHNIFWQEPNSHLNGQGCPTCASLISGGYSKNQYIKRIRGRKSYFYIIKCWDDEEEFYKIGISVYGVKGRYKRINSMPYRYLEIFSIKKEAGVVWDIELKTLQEYFKYKYYPNTPFHGKTECFNKKLPIGEIIKNINI